MAKYIAKEGAADSEVKQEQQKPISQEDIDKLLAEFNCSQKDTQIKGIVNDIEDQFNEIDDLLQELDDMKLNETKMPKEEEAIEEEK